MTALVCGTRAGYERHRRRGEAVDGACQAAKDAREGARVDARAADGICRQRYCGGAR